MPGANRTTILVRRPSREIVPSSRQHSNKFQTLAEVAHPSESLRRFRGRFEPAKSIPGSNAGAASGGESALQFRRPVVPRIDFPPRRPHIRSTTGGQELVRGRIQRDDRTVPFQLRRGNRRLGLENVDAKKKKMKTMIPADKTRLS